MEEVGIGTCHRDQSTDLQPEINLQSEIRDLRSTYS
jgi:hypothetical protein